MKTYTDYIKENEEQKPEEKLKIIELSYFDFINLCNTYKAIDHKDKYGFTICDIIKQVKDNPDTFSTKSNKYHFLAAIKNNELLGIFYKQLIGNPETYDLGYIISKGAGQELFYEMRKLGSYTTFSNISNIKSMKSQLKTGGEIIYVCDNSPDKSNGSYNKELSDNIKELMIDEKLYYKDGDDKFFFFDDKENFKMKELKEFLITHDRIELVDKNKIGDKVKVYFLFKKI
jgi:hypothetical protein